MALCAGGVPANGPWLSCGGYIVFFQKNTVAAVCCSRLPGSAPGTHYAAESTVLKTTLLQISGCQDNHVCLDGSRNGLFTETMKKVWSNGKFKYGFRRFRDTIFTQMPPTQTPNYFVLGATNAAFESQKPFTV